MRSTPSVTGKVAPVFAIKHSDLSSRLFAITAGRLHPGKGCTGSGSGPGAGQGGSPGGRQTTSVSRVSGELKPAFPEINDDD